MILHGFEANCSPSIPRLNTCNSLISKSPLIPSMDILDKSNERRLSFTEFEKELSVYKENNKLKFQFRFRFTSDCFVQLTIV